MAATSQNTRWRSELGLGHMFPGWAGVERNSRPQEQHTWRCRLWPWHRTRWLWKRIRPDSWRLNVGPQNSDSVYPFRIFEWSGIVVYNLEWYISRRGAEKKKGKKNFFLIGFYWNALSEKSKGKDRVSRIATWLWNKKNVSMVIDLKHDSVLGKVCHLISIDLRIF